MIHYQLADWEYGCAICRLPIINNVVSTVSEIPRFCLRAITIHPNRCPSKTCPLCKMTSLVYAYHPQCRDTLLQTSIGNELSKDSWFLLQFVHLMSHHKRCTPTSVSLLKDFQALFETTITTLSPHKPVALFLPLLRCLPYELQEQIFSFVLDSPGGDVLFYHEALKVLQKMQMWPEQKQRGVSCKGALFARWEAVNNTLYIAGLYEQRVADSTQIKAKDEIWDYIVLRWNDIGIIDFAFVDSRSTSHITTGPGCVQLVCRSRLTYEEIWITLKGFLISRIDISQQRSHHILWTNLAQLPLEILPYDLCGAKDLAHHVCRAKDIIAYYAPLEGITGISVAHYDQRIIAIHIHRGEEDTSLVYESAPNHATWVHCPLGASETIETIWYILSNGCGLLVKTSHKLVWLCSYIQSASPKHFFVVAIPSTKAIFYGFERTGRPIFTMGSIPDLPAPDSYELRFVPEEYDFPVPPNFTVYPRYDWSCSMASLKGVQRARTSLGGGIQLEYADFTTYLGDFRPFEALEWTESPAWLSVSSTAGSKQKVEFYSKKTECICDLKPMEGYIIVWWLSQSDILIQIEYLRHPSFMGGTTWREN